MSHMDQSRICSVAVFVIYILMSEIIGENDRLTQKPVGQKQLFCCSMSPNETPEFGSRVETQTFYLGWNKKQRIIGIYWKLLSHRLSFDMLTFPPQRGVKPFTETLKHLATCTLRTVTSLSSFVGHDLIVSTSVFLRDCAFV